MGNKILVLGAGGLLGSHFCKMYPSTIGLTRKQCDITSPTQLQNAFDTHWPYAVINCAGITRPKYDRDAYYVNGQAPHLIKRICADYGARLIQISTDCVFSGRRGKYTELATPDAATLYGRSKVLGEVTDYPHLTVRTSFIGYPDPRERGLAHWLLENEQQSVAGYEGVLWNGLTTIALCRQLKFLAYAHDINGLLHLYGPDTTKRELLQLLARVYEKDIHISLALEPLKDMRLRSVYNIFTTTPWEDMIKEMKKWEPRLA